MSLDVLMHGERVATLSEEAGGGCRLTYAPEAVKRRGAGAVLLSTALPVRPEPYGPEETRAYVEGLLPQGRRRLEIARALGIDDCDGYGLIAELGGDCLGAVAFREAESGTFEADAPGAPEWLDEEELEEALRLPERALGSALPGRRHKLALVGDEEEGRWAWPEPGLPSTHVVKPEPADRPGLAALEAACSDAYRQIGLPVAHAEFEQIVGVPCLVSKRFDRWEGPDGVELLHQESFAQALGLAPDDDARRLAPGVPMLDEAADLLRAIGEEGAIETLLTAAICDLVLGDVEPTPGGASLLFGDAGPMLAPLCDIVPTELYGEVRRRPVMIGADVPPAPLLVDVVNAIRWCGAEDQQAFIAAAKAMGDVSVAVGQAAGRAHEEGWYRRAIDETFQLASSRLKAFFDEELAYVGRAEDR